MRERKKERKLGSTAETPDGLLHADADVVWFPDAEQMTRDRPRDQSMREGWLGDANL